MHLWGVIEVYLKSLCPKPRTAYPNSKACDILRPSARQRQPEGKSPIFPARGMESRAFGFGVVGFLEVLCLGSLRDRSSCIVAMDIIHDCMPALLVLPLSSGWRVYQVTGGRASLIPGAANIGSFL